jgi:hypothetical protein
MTTIQKAFRRNLAERHCVDAAEARGNRSAVAAGTALSAHHSPCLFSWSGTRPIAALYWDSVNSCVSTAVRLPVYERRHAHSVCH